MVSVVLKVTAFAGLVSLVSSFNTNRRTEEELLDRLPSNVDRWYIFLEENYVTESTPASPTRSATTTTDAPSGGTVTDPDPLSVVWYLGAFGGLIAFFLVVTFSEWCCASKHLYRRHALAAPYLTGYSTESRAPDTPPPPYHLFAPPPYAEATCCDKTAQTPIFIIPVHQPTLPPTTLPPPPPPSPPSITTVVHT
uniref:Uncharacterized protein n=1 Tax=Panstrongylus lignarius TaxID=156445 RepID=A0A224XTP7_9HEMI